MKHQIWKRLLAFTASAAIVLTMPGVQKLAGDYVWETKAADLIADEEAASSEGPVSEDSMQAPDTTADLIIDEKAASSEEPVSQGSVQALDTISLSGDDDFAIEGMEEVENPYPAEDSSGGISQGMGVSGDADAQAMLVEAYLTECAEDTEKAEDGSKAQGDMQWIHVYVKDSGNALSGQAEVKIHLFEGEGRAPATGVEAYLYKEYQKQPSGNSVCLPAVIQGVLNENEDLTVERTQEYLTDEYGEYKKDENGNRIVTDDYLRFTLSAGDYAEFDLALLYSTDEEVYEYTVLAEAEAGQVLDGIEESVLYERYEDDAYDNEQQVTWKPQPETAESETEAETAAETESETEAATEGESETKVTTETEAESETEIVTEGESETEIITEGESETEAATEAAAENETEDLKSKLPADMPISNIRVTMTKELEETKAPEAEPEAEILSEDDPAADKTENAEKNTEQSELAVSGQTYVVHVQAEDTQQDAEYDSTVRICLTDLTTGLPAGDVAAAVAGTKEEAYSAEPAAVNTLRGAAQTAEGAQDLTVTRTQETNEAEDGTQSVTADYLEFALPAGGRADFYIGFTYETEEAAYEKQMMIEVKAVQYIPVSEFETDTAVAEELLGETPVNMADAGQELLSVSAPAANEMLGVKMLAADAAAEAVTLSEDSGSDNSSAQTVAVDVLETQAQEVLLWSAANTPSVRANASRFTAAETKKLIAYLEAHPDYVLLDTTNSSSYSVNWNNGNSGNLYCSIHVGNSDWFAQTEKNVEGVSNIWAFNLGTGNDSADMDFGYSNVWGSKANNNGNNGTALWKTETKKVSAWKGKLLQITGTVSGSGTDDNGVLHYTVAEAVFDKSPLSGKVVYLDVTNTDSMTAPPKVKIIEPDGTVAYKEMTLCPEETSVYSYRFDSYVIPDTTFQFVGQDQTSAVPAAAVSDFEKAAPCYSVELDQWIPYSPKISTVKIHVQHDFNEGITVVFTKEGKETGETIVTPTDSTFDFDLYSETYDGFYVRKASGENYNIAGNSTVIAGREDVRAAADMYETTELKAWVGNWIDNSTRRAISFAPYGTDGDSSLNIPIGAFTRKSDVLYVKSTFYDYYSDLELAGKNRSRYGTSDSSNGSNDKVQARTFNSAISNYFSSTALASGTRPSPLYFGEFTEASTTGLTNFVWANNNGEPNKVGTAAGARQGLVDTALIGGQLTMGGVIAPYFSESFLRGDNSAGTNVGYVFPEVEFPFVKNSSGYWEFDSHDADQTLRMKRDPSGFYFLDQVGAGNAVKGHNASTSTADPNFFPFNDKEQSGLWGKLNYAFGARLDIPFLMTADGTVDLGKGPEHIVFDFSGDDDIWIFIDGQLVLDIGGDHGAVDGKIDFNTCTATTTTNDTAADGCRGASYTFDKSLVDPSKEHTLTMFYMERGLWESNMKITFNFPQSNELEVEKEVVIPTKVNALFADAVSKLSAIEFPVSIENLATSYGHVDISGVQPAIEAEADLITSATSASLNTPKTSAVCAVGTYGGRSEVLKYYYPGSKNYTDGQEVTDARSIYIDTNLNFDNATQIKEKGYIQLDTYVDSSVSATDPFVALIDQNGNRVGGWISGSAYDSASKSMGSREWKTLRIVIDKLSQLDGSTFDYGHIEKIQFSYHANVNIYIDNIYIKAAPQYAASSGFTKDDEDIPDYDSRITPYQLQPVNGAEYIDNSTGESSHVTDGHIYLKDKDKVTFSDQFRRNSYLKLEETVDSNVFDTSWFLYEDGTLMESGSGAVPSDGLTAQDSNSQDITDPAKPDDTILFMSKTRSLTDYFVKTVKYVNTLKLGSISIEKALNPIDGGIPDNTDEEGNEKEYTFKIYFSNVAGMMLESPDSTYLEKTVTIAPGSENKAVISGIPVGTQYIIQEVAKNNAADSEFTLISAEHTSGDDGCEIDPVTYQVTGTVGGTATDAYKFTNDVRPSREIEGEKIWSSWDDIPEDEKPTAIEVKLEAVWSDNEESYPASGLIYSPTWVDEEYLNHLYTEPASDILGNPVPSVKVSDETDWKYQFTKLPTVKYLPDGTETELYYRVVETKVYGDAYDEDGTPIGETQFGSSFKYDQKTDAYNVENTWWDGIDLRVVKVDEKNIVTDANDVVYISGVTFTLYRQYPADDERLKEVDQDLIFACDSDNNPGNAIGFPTETSDGPHYKYVKLGQKTTDHEGNIDFRQLQNGTYYLKEESVPEGYVNPGNLWTVFKLEPGLGTHQFVEINGVRKTGFPGWSVMDETWDGEGFLWVPDSYEDYDMYLPIHNTLMRTVLEITKVDANDDTKKLSGIAFDLIKQFAPEVELDENGDPKTDAGGNPVYSKDENGDYIYPYEAETGYSILTGAEVSDAGLPASFESAVVTADGTETTVQIPYEYVWLEIQETDDNGWAAFTGAMHVDTEVDDDTDYYLTSYWGYGNGVYYLVEKGVQDSTASYFAPEGYNMLAEPIRIEIRRGGSPSFLVTGSGVIDTPDMTTEETTYEYHPDEGDPDYTVTFTGCRITMTVGDPPAPALEITKTDQSDPAMKLDGAEFTLYRRYTPKVDSYNADGTPVYKIKTKWDSSQKKYVPVLDEYGDYIYLYDKPDSAAVVTPGQDDPETERDESYGLPVSDVPYGYELIGAQTTAAGTEENPELAGIAAFQSLRDGTYVLVETKAPEGYEKLADVIVLELDHTTGKWCTTNSKFVTVEDPDTKKNICKITVENPSQMYLEVEKRDSENGDLLAGAEFTLYKQGDALAEGSTEKPPVEGMQEGYAYTISGTGATGSGNAGGSADSGDAGKGILKFVKLDNGVYYLWETKAPDGYKKIMTTPLRIEINRDDANAPVKIDGTAVAAPGETNKTSYSLEGSKITVKVENTPIKTKLQLTKVSSEGEGTKLGGVAFEIYGQYTSQEDAKKVNGTDAEIISPSDENGLPKTVTVGTETKDVVYVKIQEITTAASGDKAGLAESSELPNGTYILKEKTAAQGYVLSANLITVVIERSADPAVSTVTGTDVASGTCELDAENNLLKFTVKNTPQTTNLKLVKQDEETQAKLNGVVFNLYKPYTEPAENASTPTKAELESGLGSAVQGKLYGLVKADGTITTLSADGTLTTAKDTETNTDGIIKIRNLSNGTYYLVEKSTIEGYKLLDSVITIRIDRTAADEGSRITVTGAGVNTDGLTDGKYAFDGDTVTVTVDNVPLTKVQVTKKDGENKLAGAVFALYKEDAAGTVTSLPTGETGSFTQISASLTTSSEDAAKGTFTTDYLEPGTYYLVETAAPAGYNKLTSAVKFTVAYSNKKSSVTVVSGSGVAAGTLTETSSGSHIFAVSISDPPYTGLKIKKTGTDSTGQVVTDMSGVKFNFYRQYASSDAAKADGIAENKILASNDASLAGMNLPAEPSDVVYVLIQALTTDSNNVAAITDSQPDGTYYLVETETKDGFQKLTNPIKISISHAADAGLAASVTADGAAVQEGADGVYEITVANSMLDRTNLRIKKVDAQDSNSPLEGVEFELYRQFDGGNEADGFITAPYKGMDENYRYKLVSEADTDGHTKWITGEDGMTPSVEGLERGVYYIVETKARSGYSLLAMPIKVTINRSDSEHPIKAEYGDQTPSYPTIDTDNTAIITIQNRAKFIFPETGGYGSTIMVLGGLALAMAALFMYILQIRKKRRCTP